MITTLLSFLRRFWFALIIVIVLALIAGAFFFGRYSVYQANPELTSAEQAVAILEKVGKLIELPQGEQPQMATIEDAESVKSVQPFLANAQNGDILLVYSAAQIALLYRPSENKLIAVGPVTIDQPAAPEPVIEEPESETDNATTTDN